MKNGYKILWTDHALTELKSTIQYLKENWTEKEIRRLIHNLENTLMLIAQNPYLFQVSDNQKDVRRVVVMNLNTLFYRVNDDSVEILSFFSNRQRPSKLK